MFNHHKKIFLATEGTSKSHVYKKLYPWECSEELAEHLKSTEVCNKDMFCKNILFLKLLFMFRICGSNIHYIRIFLVFSLFLR